MLARRYLALLLVAALSLAFAPAPMTRASRRPRPISGMEGLWQGGSRLLITADRLTYHPHESPVEYVLSFDVRANPMTYDIRSVHKTDKAWDYQGIWRIEGDTLTLCYSHASHGRPKSFDGPGKGSFTEVYKRVPR